MTDAPKPQLIYFADAMCSWCYGFAPVVDAIRTSRPALPIRLINGGLRPGTTNVMDAEAKAKTRNHWEHVEAATGQKFDYSLFERNDFIYDTEPAARAVVLMRQQAGDGSAGENAEESAENRTLSFFARLQRAFYAEGQDITQFDVLAGLAAEFGVERGAFAAALAEEEAKVQAWTDFHVAQRTGVTGFPTLIAGMGEQAGWVLIAQGYRPADDVLSTIDRWLETLA